MSDTPSVSLVCCDLASVAPDYSIVERAFVEAIATQGIVTGTEAYVRFMVRFDRERGCPPAAVLHGLFEEDEARALAASIAFERSMRAIADRYEIAPPTAAIDTFGKLRASGIQVCLVSALSRACSGVVLDRLGFSVRYVGDTDLVLSADDTPRGLPWPDPVLTAILRLGVGDVREVAVVSAAESGLRAGGRAGASMLIGLRSSARTGAALRRAGATDLLPSIDLLPELLTSTDEPELRTL